MATLEELEERVEGIEEAMSDVAQTSQVDELSARVRVLEEALVHLVDIVLVGPPAGEDPAIRSNEIAHLRGLLRPIADDFRGE